MNRIIKLLEIFEDQILEIQAVEKDFLDKRSLSTSAGVQLDKLGEIPTEPRNGLTDANYRTAISTRILINDSCGESDILLIALKYITAATTVRIIDQLGTAVLYTDGTVSNTIVAQMKKLISGGVGLELRVSEGTPFVFDGDNDGLGFDEGNFSKIVK